MASSTSMPAVGPEGSTLDVEMSGSESKWIAIEHMAASVHDEDVLQEQTTTTFLSEPLAEKLQEMTDALAKLTTKEKKKVLDVQTFEAETTPRAMKATFPETSPTTGAVGLEDGEGDGKGVQPDVSPTTGAFGPEAGEEDSKGVEPNDRRGGGAHESRDDARVRQAGGRRLPHCGLPGAPSTR